MVSVDVKHHVYLLAYVHNVPTRVRKHVHTRLRFEHLRSKAPDHCFGKERWALVLIVYVTMVLDIPRACLMSNYRDGLIGTYDVGTGLVKAQLLRCQSEGVERSNRLLFLSLYVCLCLFVSICLSVCLSVCLFISL